MPHGSAARMGGIHAPTTLPPFADPQERNPTTPVTDCGGFLGGLGMRHGGLR